MPPMGHWPLESSQGQTYGQTDGRKDGPQHCLMLPVGHWPLESRPSQPVDVTSQLAAVSDADAAAASGRSGTRE